MIDKSDPLAAIEEVRKAIGVERITTAEQAKLAALLLGVDPLNPRPAGNRAQRRAGKRR